MLPSSAGALSTSADTAAAAAACSPPIRCEYRSNVNATDAWPSRALTVLAFTPAASRWLQWECRSPWSVMRGRPEAVISLSTAWVMVSGFQHEPSGMVKTRPVSFQPGPASSWSSS